MKVKSAVLTLLAMAVFLSPALLPPVVAAETAVPDLLTDDDSDAAYDDEEFDYDEEFDDDSLNATIADPLEPMNRFFFKVNDRLYDWVIKPVSDGYSYVVPSQLRGGIDNFFSNLASPVRLTNSLLQGDLDKSGIILERFVINTTAGGLGFIDVADSGLGIRKQRADFGQTLGAWGVGSGFYLYLPVLGPSSLRNLAGRGVDLYAHPTTWVVDDNWIRAGLSAEEKLNWISLHPGMMAELRKMSFDPYIASRQGWVEYRQALVEKAKRGEND